MATCANCGRDLQPAWKYCVYCGTRTTVPLAGITLFAADDAPHTSRAGQDAGARDVNRLAVAAFVVACLFSPIALIFGHIAVGQIKTSAEHGLVLAWIGIVLGYVWLVTLAVLVIAFITTNA